MKSFITKKMILINVIYFTLLFCTPLFSIAQNKCEIKDFNKSFTFTNTHTIDLETNTDTETISGFTFIAKFSIDKNGQGTIDSKMVGAKSTLVRVDYSQIKKFNQMIIWNFGCTHNERPEKIQMTLEINPESNTIERFVIYNEAKRKAFVFY